LRSQKYAEVAENSLRLIRNVSITKTWFSKLLQVARLIFYPETSIGIKISASLVGDLSLEEYFFKKYA
jgi:hypothetical protein